MLSLAVAAFVAVQQPSPGVGFAVQPSVPRQGSLITLLVTAPSQVGDSVVAVLGELSGEPLHFVRGRAGVFRALGGVPLDAPKALAVRLQIQRTTGVIDTTEIQVLIAHRVSKVERIVTAQRFIDTPDSAELGRITAERELARDVARHAHDVPRLWTESFVRPRPKASRVTSRFGIQRRVNGVLGRKHAGLDLAGEKGAPVRAANRGVVATVGDWYYGGISVYVYHGDGLTTAYHHLSRATVAMGDTVARGQVIGRVGATGRVTGPHLHWGVQYGRVSVDPADLLKLLAASRDSSR